MNVCAAKSSGAIMCLWSDGVMQVCCICVSEMGVLTLLRHTEKPIAERFYFGYNSFYCAWYGMKLIATKLHGFEKSGILATSG